MMSHLPATRRAGKGAYTFDPPGSTGTAPAGINPAGAITGYYVDANGGHGFLWSHRHTEGREAVD